MTTAPIAILADIRLHGPMKFSEIKKNFRLRNMRERKVRRMLEYLENVDLIRYDVHGRYSYVGDWRILYHQITKCGQNGPYTSLSLLSLFETEQTVRATRIYELYSDLKSRKVLREEVAELQNIGLVESYPAGKKSFYTYQDNNWRSVL